MNVLNERSEKRDSSLTHKQMVWCILTFLAVITRLYRTDLPKKICWDETHHGKMVGWYFNRTFFFDVHPPGGRLSLALAGYLTGYDGRFDWEKAGNAIPDDSHTVGMRNFCALLGALLVPLTFGIVHDLSDSTGVAAFAGSLLLFDTGTTVLTR